MADFVPKDWQNAPSTATPLNEAALDDLEARVEAAVNSRIESAEKGAVNGVATLGADGLLTESQRVGSGSPATATTQGVIKLAGDLSGTADAPTVPGLGEVSEIVVEQDGSYPARMTTGPGLFIGTTNPGALLQPGDAWWDSSGQGSGAGVGELAADETVPDGTTDNTAYLAGLLGQAITAGKTLRIPPSAQPWCISELALPSNARVNATGARFVLPTGVRKRMLVNAAMMQATPGTTRDSNISWEGGTFDHGNINGDTVGATDSLVIGLGFIDRLQLKNMRVVSTGTNTGGKAGYLLWANTNFLVENIDFAHVSGGVQIRGASLNGLVRNITGSTGDDSVAVFPTDGASAQNVFTNGNGGPAGITVEGVFTTCYRTGVKIMSGNDGASNPVPVHNILVRDVRGSFGTSGGTDVAGVRVGGGEGPYPRLTGGILDGVLIDGVVQLNTGAPAVTVYGACNTHGLVVRAVSVAADAPAVTVDTSASSGLTSMKVADCVFSSVKTSGSYYPITNNSTTLRNLELENIRLTAAATGTATVAPYSNGSGGVIVARNVRVTGLAYVLGSFTGTTPRVFASGCYGEDSGAKGYFVVSGTAPAVMVYEWNVGSWTGTDDFTKSAGTVTCYSLGFHCDVSKLVKVANGMAFNTNAALSCGVGPVVCDGTSWKHLFTGATY